MYYLLLLQMCFSLRGQNSIRINIIEEDENY